MKNSRLKTFVLGLLILSFNSCIEPYQPPQIIQETSFLVVDGYLNPMDTSIIRLTRTQQLDEAGSPPVEANARVSVEGERGGSISFSEKEKGVYELANFQPSSGEKYRLRIRTAGNKEYLSDYVPVKITPAIDSVSWEALGDGLHVYVNTHDPENNTKYYLWDFEETWEFTVPYPAHFEYLRGNTTIITENLAQCWRTEPSKNIYVSSSAQLSEDIIHKFQVAYMPIGSPKYNKKYSILVRQHAITKEAYEYMQNLRKNTENLGTLFDPLPSQVTGNITCVNAPEERVFGFFNAYSTTEKRIFISRDQLPKWPAGTGFEYCLIDTVKAEQLSGAGSTPRKFHSEVYATSGPPVLIGYTESAITCMDCRITGTNVKPDFWQ